MKDGFNIKKYNMAAAYYPALALVYALTLVSFDIFRPGIAAAILACLTWIWLFAAKVFPPIKEFRVPDIVMSVWLLYNIASGIWGTLFGMPVSVYLGELFTCVLAFVFYYAAAYCDEKERLKFYKWFLAAVFILGFLGLFLYISAPRFYIDYLFDHGLISKADVQTMRVRMVSVTGSTVLGYLGVAGMPVSIKLAAAEKRKSWYAAAAASCFIAFMSNQRAAMGAAIFVVIYFNMIVFFVYKRLNKKYFYAEFAAVILFASILFLAARGAFMKVFYRLVSLPLAIGERSGQWVDAANNMGSIWIGNGLGANGHRALSYTRYVIADGGLAKLYCETGIIGTALFAFLILLVLKRGFCDLKKYACEVCVVLITLMISIGSNTLSFALSVPVFYFAAGVLSTGVMPGGKDT